MINQIFFYLTLFYLHYVNHIVIIFKNKIVFIVVVVVSKNIFNIHS